MAWTPTAGCNRPCFSKRVERLPGGLVGQCSSALPTHSDCFSASVAVPWHHPPSGWQSKELPLQQHPASKFVVGCVGTERVVKSFDKIVIVMGIVNHTEEFLIAKGLYFRALFSGQEDKGHDIWLI